MCLLLLTVIFNDCFWITIWIKYKRKGKAEQKSYLIFINMVFMEIDYFLRIYKSTFIYFPTSNPWNAIGITFVWIIRLSKCCGFYLCCYQVKNLYVIGAMILACVHKLMACDILFSKNFTYTALLHLKNNISWNWTTIFFVFMMK